MTDSKCKICRRAGVKLFLKGERCLSPKCAIVRNPTPPGPRGKRRRSALSEYGKELREKQELKNWYNLTERQFGKYVRSILEKHNAPVSKGKTAKTENASTALIKKLELRLDNVVYRLGFSTSREQARQLVSHGHFLVNGKSVKIPFYELRLNDKIAVKPSSVKKAAFQNILVFLKKHINPTWITFNPEKLEAEIIEMPTLEEASPPVEIPAIFEFYSR